MKVLIYLNNELIFDGFMNGYPTGYDDNSLTFECITALQKAFDNINYINYYSSSELTPAEHLENILIEYGFSSYINSASFNYAKFFQNSLGLLTTINSIPLLEDEVNQFSIYDLIQKFSQVGNANVYINSDNLLYYEVYNEDKAKLPIKSLDGYNFAFQSIDYETYEPFQEYEINTLEGVVTSFEILPDNVLSLSFGSDDIIQITTLSGGVELGQQYILRSQEKHKLISLTFSEQFGEIFNLNSYYYFSLDKYNISNMLIEPIEIKWQVNAGYTITFRSWE